MTRGLDIKGYALEVYRDPEDDAWVAEVPDLPGCLAASVEASELLAAADDAIEAWIAAARADGRPVPAPSPMVDDYSGRFVLRVPKSLHRKLARFAKRDGVSLNTYCVSALSGAVAAPNTPSAPMQWREPSSSIWGGALGRPLAELMFVEGGGTPYARMVVTASLGQGSAGLSGERLQFRDVDADWPLGTDFGVSGSSYMPIYATRKG